MNKQQLPIKSLCISITSIKRLWIYLYELTPEFNFRGKFKVTISKPQPLPAFPYRYRQPVNTHSIFQSFPVYLCAFPHPGKKAPGFFLLAIHLPGPATQIVAAAVFYKLAHIVSRIPQKDPDFVRKLISSAKPSFKAFQPLRHAVLLIAQSALKVLSHRIFKAVFQPFRAVNVYERCVFPEKKHFGFHALWRQAEVQFPEAVFQTQGIGTVSIENTRSSQPCQSCSTVFYNITL